VKHISAVVTRSYLQLIIRHVVIQLQFSARVGDATTTTTIRKVHPVTGHEGPEGELYLLFL
jgi:hypothetical protein